MNFSLTECHNYKDYRGNLIEFVNENFLHEKDLPFGQIYLVTFEGKNMIRGNHYHETSSETFCVVMGDVEIILEDIETKERYVHVFRSGELPIYRIMIGPKIAHSIRSLTDYAIVISYASKVYDQAVQDKFAYQLN